MIRAPMELPGGKNRMARRMKNPYCSRNGRIWYSVRRSRKANSTFEPSSGGIGIRLKTISSRLIWTNRSRTWNGIAGTCDCSSSGLAMR